MIDLHSDFNTILKYVDKYRNYLPASDPSTQQRMQYNYDNKSLDSFLKSYTEKTWDSTPSCHIPSEHSRDRAIGALIGLAVGDAVGTTLEFLPRDVAHVNDMEGGGPFRLHAGEWTDDTSMALCLAETLLEKGDADTTCFRSKLLDWYQHGYNSSNGVCFDIGNVTRYALEQYTKFGAGWNADTAPESAGNASIIRQAPVSIFFRNSMKKAFYEAKKQSIATHGAAEAINSAQYLSYLLVLMINGHNKEFTFAPHIMPLQPRVMIVNAGEYKQKTRDQIRSSGYVIDTLEAAMWSVWNTNNFRDAILLAANLADDADSVAATAGQIAGALYGYSGIPLEWRNKLVQHERITKIAGELFDRAPEGTFIQ
ncbi:ADP-ribosylarginine hydrolase Tri1 [Enterobacter sp. JS8-1]|uniref:ADP-ribosylarginine hydrolase Tri1 n=1 Tax=Enterobacter sp. JS8-1 TaxID=3411633 RepID=UPI003BA02E94